MYWGFITAIFSLGDGSDINELLSYITLLCIKINNKNNINMDGIKIIKIKQDERYIPHRCRCQTRHAMSRLLLLRLVPMGHFKCYRYELLVLWILGGSP